MKTASVAKQNHPIDFDLARSQAATSAERRLEEPVLVAWKDDTTGRFAPEIPGGSSDRWHDYGESNGGKLEVTVGDEFHFIFAEATDFEQPELKLANLTTDTGTTFLCLNEACTEQDRRQLGVGFGGGTGDG